MPKIYILQVDHSINIVIMLSIFFNVVFLVYLVIGREHIFGIFLNYYIVCLYAIQLHSVVALSLYSCVDCGYPQEFWCHCIIGPPRNTLRPL